MSDRRGDYQATTASLREWYAGLALQGVLAGPEGGQLTADNAALQALACADALLARLEEPRNG